MIKKISIFIMILFMVFFSSYEETNAVKDYHILNKPTATKEQIYEWANNNNATDLYLSWIDMGYDIAKEYGIDPTVMFAQMAIETGFGKFGGVIDASYHNVAGIKTSKGGSNSDPNAHARFKSWEQGITAQAQHLSLYAGEYIKNKSKIVDPRYFKELQGTAYTVSQLSSRWASGSRYGNDINRLCDNIVNTKADKKTSKNSKTKDKVKDIKNNDEKTGVDLIKEKLKRTNAYIDIDYIMNIIKR